VHFLDKPKTAGAPDQEAGDPEDKPAPGADRRRKAS
jgi:hypothetical protein